LRVRGARSRGSGSWSRGVALSGAVEAGGVAGGER
jgi:hypothetical protein